MRGTRWGEISIVLLGIACIAMIVLRCVVLDADAFSGLSWSSALLTDEGFYIHNARNMVLFGTYRTDQFNNMLIMPGLHALQLVVFRTWGVGVIQARSISVGASLVSLPLFYYAVDRSLGRRHALAATVFLGLDHVYLLYNRLALMDSPAASVLILGLCFWVAALSNSGNTRKFYLFCCGLTYIMAYSIRGLAAPLAIAPIATLVTLQYASRSPGPLVPCKLKLSNGMTDIVFITSGLAAGFAIYLSCWYIPNHYELARVNRYYFHQLMPDTLSIAAYNVVGSLFGNARGFSAYLIRHTPVAFMLAVAWFLTGFRDAIRCPGSTQDHATASIAGHPSPDEPPRQSIVGRSVLILSGWWMLILWAVLAVAQYSPDRYYVLAFPALAIVSAHAFWNLPNIIDALRSRKLTAAFVCCLFAYHGALALSDRIPNLDVKYAIAWSSAAAISVGLTSIRCSSERISVFVRIRIQNLRIFIVTAWFAINVIWMSNWLGHLTYRQRNADMWLAAHLPANSVVFGAVAPGLCMNSRFRVVSVIQGLCNDNDPLKYRDRSREYVLILDNSWREGWWDVHYPDLLGERNRIMSFPHMLRTGFTVSVYDVH